MGNSVCGMHKLVGLSLVAGLLLVGCAPASQTAKTSAGGHERTPAWVDTVGAECGVMLTEPTRPDLTAECGAGEALYVP